MTMPFILSNPKLAIVLQVHSQEQKDGGTMGAQNHLPCPAGCTLANIATGCPHELGSLHPWRDSKPQMDVVLEDLLQVTLFELGVHKMTSRGQTFYETTQDPAGHLCCKGTHLTPVQLLHQDTQAFFSKAAFLAIIFHFRPSISFILCFPMVFQQ